MEPTRTRRSAKKAKSVVEPRKPQVTRARSSSVGTHPPDEDPSRHGTTAQLRHINRIGAPEVNAVPEDHWAGSVTHRRAETVHAEPFAEHGGDARSRFAAPPEGRAESTPATLFDAVPVDGEQPPIAQGRDDGEEEAGVDEAPIPESPREQRLRRGGSGVGRGVRAVETVAHHTNDAPAARHKPVKHVFVPPQQAKGCNWMVVGGVLLLAAVLGAPALTAKTTPGEGVQHLGHGIAHQRCHDLLVHAAAGAERNVESARRIADAIQSHDHHKDAFKLHLAALNSSDSYPRALAFVTALDSCLPWECRGQYIPAGEPSSIKDRVCDALGVLRKCPRQLIVLDATTSGGVALRGVDQLAGTAFDDTVPQLACSLNGDSKAVNTRKAVFVVVTALDETANGSSASPGDSDNVIITRAMKNVWADRFQQRFTMQVIVH